MTKFDVREAEKRAKRELAYPGMQYHRQAAADFLALLNLARPIAADLQEWSRLAEHLKLSTAHHRERTRRRVAEARKAGLEEKP